MTLTLSTRLRPSGDTLMRVLDGEAVLLGLKTAGYYGLDPVGTRIFTLIEERGLLADVLTGVLEEFDVERDRAERDLLALCERLIASGLVDVVDERPSPG